jgi:D-sedoheptulose 7-phosphate isomerase
MEMEILNSYFQGVSTAVANLPVADVRAAVEVLHTTYARGGTAYLVGNGGSAATASHLMNDLNKLTRIPGVRPFRAMAMTDCVPLLTAWANDDSYENAFSEALSNFIQAGDALVAISTSGNSPNIVNAVTLAKARGVPVVGLSGRTGGRLRALADICVCVPSDDIGQQEDAHLVLCHAMAYALRQKLRDSR